MIPIRNSYRDDTLTVGQVVKAVGAQGDRIKVELFDPAVDDSKTLVGVISEEIAGGADGHAQVYGELRNINTDAFEVGDILYPQSDGSLDTTENEYPVGIVTRKQVNTGRLFIRLWAPGKGYHQRYRTEALSEMFVGVGATVELYYTATADGDGYVTQNLTAAVGDGNVEERVLYYKAEAFGDSGTTVGYTNAGLATDATYAEMLTAFNNLLKTESAPITVYATRTEVSGRSGLLADYPGAAAAYSLRLLDTDYSGSAIRVRRASDNAEQDIGFDGNGDLDTTSLASFCSGTNGFCKVWYDQSGNANNATQTTTSEQPKIYDGTSDEVVTDNGKPALEFNGTAQYFITNDLIVEMSQNDAAVYVVKNSAPSSDEYIISEGDNDSPYSSQFILGGTASNSGFIWVNTTVVGTISATRALLSFDYASNAIQCYQNGASAGSATGLTINVEAYGFSAIGGRADGTTGESNCFGGKMQEIITYKSDQSTNRTNIETNINDYYNIYTP